MVQQFTSDGTLLTQWNSAGDDGINIPTFNGYGIAFDSSGKLFIVDTFNNRIQKYETNVTLITQFGIAGTGDGEFDSAHDLAINASDNIFVSDTNNHRVQVFAPNNPPVAEDQQINIKKNKATQITLSAIDPDGDTLTFSIQSGPSHGTISNFDDSAGTLTYTPDKKFIGTDQLTFKVTDNNGATSNIATVSLVISNKPSIAISLDSILESLTNS